MNFINITLMGHGDNLMKVKIIGILSKKTYAKGETRSECFRKLSKKNENSIISRTTKNN